MILLAGYELYCTYLVTANPNLVTIVVPEASEDILCEKQRLWWNTYRTVLPM